MGSLPEIPGYRVVRELGSGASGHVFLAEQLGLARQVALKVLAPGLFDAAQTRTRFVRESRLQARLKHPNLVELYDAGVAGESPYLVTELVEGGTLTQRLEATGPMSLAEVARIGAGIALGLACAHQAGIVHRDLKPDNVLFGADGQPKIADFGLAKGQATDRMVMTSHGLIIGTPGYMAPEVIEGLAAGPAADVYALGVMLVEMATGRRLHGQGSPMEILRHQMEMSQSSAWLGETGVPALLEPIAAGCTASRPEERPTAAEVATGLGSHELPGPQAAGTRTVSMSLRRPSRRSRAATTANCSLPDARATVTATRVALAGSRRGWRRAVVLALGFLTLAGAGTWLAFRGQPPGDSAAVGPARSVTTGTVPAPGAGPGQPRAASPRLSVAVGSSCARLSATPAPQSSIRLAYRARGSPQVRQFTLDAGASSVLVQPMAPESAYELEVVGGHPAWRTTFRTLKSSRYPGSAPLGPVVDDLDALAVTGRGSRVSVVWVAPTQDRKRTVLLRESHDGGLTWSETQSLSGQPVTTLTRVAVASSDDGVLAAWNQNNKAVLRFRREGSTEWSAPLEIDSYPPGPALAAAGPGAFDVLTVGVVRDRGACIFWQRLDVTRMRLGPSSPVVFEPYTFVQWVGLASPGGQPRIFYRGMGRAGSEVVRYLANGRPASDPWPESLELPLPCGGLMRPSVTSSGPQVFLFATDQARAYLYRVGALDEQPAPLPVPTNPDLPFLTSAVWLGNRLYSAICWGTPQFLEQTGVTVASTADLSTWRPEGRVPLSMSLHMGLRMAVTPEGVLLVTKTLVEGLVVHPLRFAARPGGSHN